MYKAKAPKDQTSSQPEVQKLNLTGMNSKKKADSL
jgi:hypothetical protein